MISFYAAAIGVMFLMFTASGSAGALLDEAESGTLDRVLSTRVTMTKLLAGKLVFNTALAFIQLVAMFLWGWAVFKLDFFNHLPGFVVMGLCTAFAVAAFGMLLASACRTRAQLGALSTLLILIMSSVGGSMFPRFLMPESMQKAGLLTINAWAIDGFTKVFWRDLPVKELWPQVTVLLAVGVGLFAIARRVARRWEMARSERCSNRQRRSNERRRAMDSQTNNAELTERLKLIESMMAEGRQRTESWGWTFVLWGVAYLWQQRGLQGWLAGRLGQRYLAWPVTMIAASIATGVAISRMKKGQPATTLGGPWGDMGGDGHLALCCSHVAGIEREVRHACVRGDHRRNAGRGQYGLGHHSEVEDAVCVRGGVAGVGSGGLFWHGKPGRDCVSCGYVFLPDCLRHLRHDPRVAAAQAERSGPCLSCRS